MSANHTRRDRRFDRFVCLAITKLNQALHRAHALADVPAIRVVLGATVRQQLKGHLLALMQNGLGFVRHVLVARVSRRAFCALDRLKRRYMSAEGAQMVLENRLASPCEGR